MKASYAWYIYRSWLETEPLADNITENSPSTVYFVSGPNNIDKTIEAELRSIIDHELINKPKYNEAQLAKKNIQRFRLFDDDGNLYYEGLLWVHESAFDSDDYLAPLDDYGTPHAGATEMKVKSGKKWLTV